MSPLSEQAVNGEKSEITSSPASPLPQREAGDEDGDTAENNVVEVRDNSQLVSLMGGVHCFFFFFFFFVILTVLLQLCEMSR